MFVAELWVKACWNSLTPSIVVEGARNETQRRAEALLENITLIALFNHMNFNSPNTKLANSGDH